MNKYLLALAITTALSSNYALAAEEIDMSSPTEAYTALGAGYGNKGVSLKAMYTLSSADSNRKSGLIFEANDIFDQEGGDPQFSGIKSGVMTMDGETTNTNYRFRYGSLDTTNGLGHMVDAVVKDHPFFGQMAIVQAGALATIPVGENGYIWPVILVGGVIMEDNFSDTTGAAAGLPESVTNLSSSGVDIASTVFTTKIYARYKFNETWWLLGSWSYTDEINGKSWNESIAEGGLQISPQQIELTLGYQLTPTQNIRFNYHSYSDKGSSDKLWVEYNYAF
ncbi:hypothetical protein [Shewanella youngdeokensis]|uniref:Uncharacterized protein n=1 Tax=Shewanella youngdeokensis TaxID=2999068 RepID=A0ABZ0JUM2_9GAMM|nr:hypothetical protein RGE70_11760 [Shewanella sp. DAU334]